MGLIKKELSNLKDSDIMSFLLFALFKLKETNEYSALSELAYILDKHNLLNLCEYFGGLTITIPTIDELETLLNALLLYKFIDVDRMSEEEALFKIREDIDLKATKKCYGKIRELLDAYSITSRGKI